MLFLGVIKIGDNIGKTIITYSKIHNVDMIVIGSRGPNLEFEIFFFHLLKVKQAKNNQTIIPKRIGC